jgi:hypothetical protein
MIALGSVLRHTALPREILAVLYTAMGGALALASLIYFGGLRGNFAGRRPSSTNNRPRPG